MKSIPREWNPSSPSTSCLTLRAKRSNLQTTTTRTRRGGRQPVKHSDQASPPWRRSACRNRPVQCHPRCAIKSLPAAPEQRSPAQMRLLPHALISLQCSRGGRGQLVSRLTQEPPFPTLISTNEFVTRVPTVYLKSAEGAI